MVFHGSTIAAIGLALVLLVAALLIKWVQRQILLAWLGVKTRWGAPPGPLQRVLLRFEKMQTSVWMFAWFKVRLDPMFRELPGLLREIPSPRTILDVGCGHGIASRALLEWLPEATLVGIDASRSRVRCAAKIFADRGRAIRAAAPDLPTGQLPDRVDAVFVLDVIHYLNDAQLESTLRQIRQRLAEGASLVIRDSIPESSTKSLLFRLEAIERFFTREHVYYRTADQIGRILRATGFDLRRRQRSGDKGELCWFIAAAGVSENLR